MNATSVTSFTDAGWHWLNQPQKKDGGECEHEGTFTISADGSTFIMYPLAQKDFWSRTFYEPLLIKSDASGLLYTVGNDTEATVKIDFELNPQSQFDQAGLLIHLDDDHWVKCGIEFCDGHVQLSVVVCNVFSDWSVQPWSNTGARLKVHKVRQSNSIVIEAAEPGSDTYRFVRIAHLSTTATNSLVPQTRTAPAPPSSFLYEQWKIGPFAACPSAQRGCHATFSNVSVGPKETSEHSPNLA